MCSRVDKAVQALQRVSYLPFGIEARARFAGSHAGTAIATGIAFVRPSLPDQRKYMRAMKNALLPRGERAWVCMPLLFVILVRGHLLDVTLIAHNVIIRDLHAALNGFDKDRTRMMLTTFFNFMPENGEISNQVQ